MRIESDMNHCSHTPSPIGYLAWHDWADKISKTHKQVKCKSCGLFKVWIDKKTGKQLIKEIYH